MVQVGAAYAYRQYLKQCDREACLQAETAASKKDLGGLQAWPNALGIPSFTSPLQWPDCFCLCLWLSQSLFLLQLQQLYWQRARYLMASTCKKTRQALVRFDTSVVQSTQASSKSIRNVRTPEPFNPTKHLQRENRALKPEPGHLRKFIAAWQLHGPGLNPWLGDPPAKARGRPYFGRRP